MPEVHVFGVVHADTAGAPAGARLIGHRELAALVSEAAGATPSAVLREHWRILEEAAATTTVLPLRFGTVMPGDREVVDQLLAPAHDELVARLQELAGKVQLTVKAFYEQEALMRGVVETSPPVARLRERVRGLPEAAAYYERIRLGELVAAEVEKARERDAVLMLERLEPLACASSREPISHPEAAMSAAFLVERERVDAFSEAVARLAEEVAGRIRLRYVGPLPPYSFTEGDLTEAGAAWA